MGKFELFEHEFLEFVAVSYMTRYYIRTFRTCMYQWWRIQHSTICTRRKESSAQDNRHTNITWWTWSKRIIYS